ncbi:MULTISPECIES: hypothetical protein [Corynebacterium]|uniref:hypothetical protein n=1 Tax=Corynebacterium TaxID=1716 RepID=UPI00124D7DAF|nr:MULTISPECIES: hypothetical protein [Corynebacterium]
MGIGKAGAKWAVCAVATALLLGGCAGSDEGVAASEFDTKVAPASARWSSEATRGIAVPEADQGPEKVDPVPHGWDESPQGAVLAAINAQTYMATAGEQTWPEVSRHMLADGQGRDQWVQARSLMDIDGQVDNPPVFKGFRFSEFSGEKAVVVLAADYPSQGLLGYPVQLDRSSGDWRVVLPVQGEEPDLQAITDEQFDDFVRFSPDE